MRVAFIISLSVLFIIQVVHSEQKGHYQCGSITGPICNKFTLLASSCSCINPSTNRYLPQCSTYDKSKCTIGNDGKKYCAAETNCPPGSKENQLCNSFCDNTGSYCGNHQCTSRFRED